MSDAKPAPDRFLWLIYSREHNAFWRAARCGYTHDITQAGRYSESEAAQCCKTRDQQRDGSPSEIMIIAPEIGARVVALEGALRKYGLQERQGLTYHGFTRIGFRCQLCECEWVEPERENHDQSCLLHGTSRVAPATGDAYG